MNDFNKELSAFNNYLISQRGLSVNTINSYSKDLTSFFEYLDNEGLTLDGLKRTHIRGYLALLHQKRMTATSINRHLSALKTFIKYKKRFGYKDTANILEIESLKNSRYLPTFLFHNEFDTLI